jgi:hypothetical protein
LDNERRKQVAGLIEQVSLFGLGGGVLLIVMLVALGGSPVVLMSASAGVGLMGRAMLRPSTRPPRWIPAWPGLEEERAQEEDLHAFISQHISPSSRAKMRYIIIVELVILCGIFLLTIFFQPFWPSLDLFLVVMGIVVSFLAGVGIAMATCWLSVYKDLLR